MKIEGLCAECQEMSDLIQCDECGEYYCVCCYDFEKCMCKGCYADKEDDE